MHQAEQSFFQSLDWLQPELAEAEQLRRTGDIDAASHAALNCVRGRLKASMPDLPRLDLCGDLPAHADKLLDRRVDLLNAEIQLDTPVDWGKLAATDGQRNWHLGYFYWLNALSHQYAETGDERYAQQWCTYVTEFIDGCPYATDARGYWPTRPMVANDLKTCNLGENGGPHQKEAPLNQQSQWMSLSCHFRIETWLAGLARLADSPALDDALLIRILESLVNDHAYVCVMNPRENTPNQFTAVTLSLLKLSLLLPMHRSCASYFLVAWERLQRVYSNNLLPDGSDLEQSPDYNAFLLDLSIEVLELLKDAPESRRSVIREAAIKRLRFLTAILMPGNLQPPIGKGHAEDKTKSFLHAAEVLGDAVSLQALKDQSGPLRESISFPYGGYHCLRDDDSYLLFKNSRMGSGHMHEDCLSFILWHKGVELLTDPSHYTYNNDTEEETALNTYALGTQGHNSICINGHGQRRLPLSKEGPRADDECPLIRAAEQQPLEDRIAVGNHFSFLEGQYSDGYGSNNEMDATHARTIVNVKGHGWLVIDRILNLDTDTKVQQHWHLADHFESGQASLIHDSELFAKNTNGQLRILRLDAAPIEAKLECGQMDPVQGWAFPKYGSKQAAVELVWKSECSKDSAPLITWIESNREASAPDSNENKSANWEGSSVQWTTTQGQRLQLKIHADHCELLTTEASLQWSDKAAMPVEKSSGKPEHPLKPIGQTPG